MRKFFKRLIVSAVAIAVLLMAVIGALQIPAVQDEARCAITHLFYDVYSPGPVPSNTSVVDARAQTQPVDNPCDAADDPAIWVNRDAPEKSLILGTNKLHSINVYNLAGERLHQHRLGAPNNVDVRELTIDGRRRVIVGASDKDQGEIVVLELNPDTAELTERLAEPIQARQQIETYGFCFYQNPSSNELYAIATDKSGQIEQWHLTPADNNRFSGTLVRVFSLGSQVEACVADDANQTLFVAEEDVGIWRFDAEPDGSTDGELIARAGEALSLRTHLVADVEGLAIYAPPGADSGGYLMASSQGNDTYVVFDRRPPHAYRATFQIQMDGVRTGDTDGIEITALPVGDDYPLGMVIVQDGAPAWLDRGNQNFKIVSWLDLVESMLPAEP